MTKPKHKGIQTFYLIASFIFFIIYLYFEFILNGKVLGIMRLFLLLFGCIFAGLYSYKKHNKITAQTYLCFFVVYAAFLLNLTLFDSLYGRHVSLIFKETDIQSYLSGKTNLIPFNTLALYIKGYANSYVELSALLTNLLGNIIAFMPFGFFLPLFFKKCNNTVVFLITVTLTVLFIELAQLVLMTGAFDVDDIILNVGGSLISFIFSKYILIPSVKK